MTTDTRDTTFLLPEEYAVTVDYRLNSRRTLDRLVAAWGHVGKDDLIYSPPNDILKMFFTLRPIDYGVRQINVRFVGISEPMQYWEVETALDNIEGFTPLCAYEIIALATACPHQLYGKKMLALGNILSVTEVTRGMYPGISPSKKSRERMYAIFLMVTKLGICVRQHSLKDEKLPDYYLFPVKAD